MTNEAFARVKIDPLLQGVGWRLTHGLNVRFECRVADRSISNEAY